MSEATYRAATARERSPYRVFGVSAVFLWFRKNVPAKIAIGTEAHSAYLIFRFAEGISARSTPRSSVCAIGLPTRIACRS